MPSVSQINTSPTATLQIAGPKHSNIFEAQMKNLRTTFINIIEVFKENATRKMIILSEVAQAQKDKYGVHSLISEY